MRTIWNGTSNSKEILAFVRINNTLATENMIYHKHVKKKMKKKKEETIGK